MKRFHVHVHVDDLARSIGFYSKLFAAEPTRVESDYAKWMLDDPRLNFAITDPQGIAWEHFHTLGTIALFREAGSTDRASACCTPAAASPSAAEKPACCRPATSSTCC